jgi:hypothetical protein
MQPSPSALKAYRELLRAAHKSETLVIPLVRAHAHMHPPTLHGCHMQPSRGTSLRCRRSARRFAPNSTWVSACTGMPGMWPPTGRPLCRCARLTPRTHVDQQAHKGLSSQREVQARLAEAHEASLFIQESVRGWPGGRPGTAGQGTRGPPWRQQRGGEGLAVGGGGPKAGCRAAPPGLSPFCGPKRGQAPGDAFTQVFVPCARADHPSHQVLLRHIR